MGTNECSQPASKSSWDSQDFGDVNMVLKMVHFHKSSRPQWVKWVTIIRIHVIKKPKPLMKMYDYELLVKMSHVMSHVMHIIIWLLHYIMSCISYIY